MAFFPYRKYGKPRRGRGPAHREQDNFSSVLEQCKSIIIYFSYSGVQNLYFYNANLDIVHNLPLPSPIPRKKNKKAQLDIYQHPGDQ